LVAVALSCTLCLPGLAQVNRRWSAVCDSKGRLHAVECRQADGTVVHRIWDGKQWAAPTVAWTGFIPFSPTLAVDAQGNAHIVWGIHNSFGHVYSKDGQWVVGAQG